MRLGYSLFLVFGLGVTTSRTGWLDLCVGRTGEVLVSVTPRN